MLAPEDAHTIGHKGGSARMRKLRGHAAFARRGSADAAEALVTTADAGGV